MSKEVSLFKKHLEMINRCWNYAKRCKTKNDEILNAALGVGGEAGEIVDQVKKMLYHSEKPEGFHREKLVKEFGDSFYYHIKLMDLLDITLEEALESNVEKLESRHPELGKVKERFSGDYIK